MPDYAISDDCLVISFRSEIPRAMTPGLDVGMRVTVSLYSRPETVASLMRKTFGIELHPQTLKPISDPLKDLQRRVKAMGTASPAPA